MRDGKGESKEMVAAGEMERWRSYFDKAGADIWTVIKEAINIGAIDFPTDFRERRCEIAETLFAKNLVMSLSSKLACSEKHEPGGGDQRISKITIYDRGNGDAMRPNHSHGETYDADASLENHHQDGDISIDEEKEDFILIRAINGVKSTIISGDQDENVVVEALQRLQCLQITVGALKATEIGKQVKVLKKHPAKRVRALVKELVRGWKVLVDEWACTNMDGSTAAVDTGACDCPDMQVKEDGMTLPLINQGPHIEQAEDLGKLFSFMDDEICIADKDGLQHASSVEPSAKDSSIYLSRSLSGSMLTDSSDFDTKASTNYPWGHPTPEERGSATRDVYPSFGNFEKQTSSLIGQATSQDKGEQWCGLKSSKGTSAATNPGRPRGELDKKVKPVPVGMQASRHDSMHKTYSAQKIVAVPSSNDMHSLKLEKNELDEKLEFAKRKLHQGYQQAENAKKQRTVQVLNFQEGVKAGQNGKVKVNAPAPNKGILPAQNKTIPFRSSHGCQSKRFY